jgi:anti-sigma regulatory factor (Ser/Thr protein kinase)/DNA-binding MarR family transcriptional regulator
MSKRQGEEAASASGPQAKRQNVKEAIRELLSGSPGLSGGQLAAELGLTRQAIHYHLAKLLDAGEIGRRGGGRGSRYFLLTDFSRRYLIPGLEEHRVWEDILRALPEMQGLRPNVRSILEYALTEIVNNAIEHSAGRTVKVDVSLPPDSTSFVVVDDGVGIFRHVQERFELEDEFAAVGELSKGKRTTAPEGHSGEGIFFTSKAVDRFVVDSRGLRWIVDNARGDQAVGEAPFREGTRVRWELERDATRTLTDVFDRYTDPDTLRFDRSRLEIRLFERGGSFVSRSEARRLTSHLEPFREVVLDFAGVNVVGQAFVDELFRVWAPAHPETRLIPINVSPTVDKMIQRGLPPPR